MVVQLRDIGVVFMVPVRENPLAQNLKRLRRSRAMTQEQLAERAEAAPPAVLGEQGVDRDVFQGRCRRGHRAIPPQAARP